MILYVYATGPRSNIALAPLTRRLQLVLDEERHNRLIEESRRSHRSVSSLVRESIDARFDLLEGPSRTKSAATELLAAPRPADREPDWAEVERELLDSSAPRTP